MNDDQESPSAVDINFENIELNIKDSQFLDQSGNDGICDLEGLVVDQSVSLFGETCQFEDLQQQFPQADQSVLDIFENLDTALKLGQKEGFFALVRPEEFSDKIYRKEGSARSAGQ